VEFRGDHLLVQDLLEYAIRAAALIDFHGFPVLLAALPKPPAVAPPVARIQR